MTKRDRIRNRFNGKCAYTGSLLKDDWQIDHIEPLHRNSDGSYMFPDALREDNLFPCQKIVNHYKGSLSLEEFRTWFLGGLHTRLKKLPKNPKSDKLIKRKAYLLEVAELFGITEDRPFSGKFYFETFTHSQNI